MVYDCTAGFLWRLRLWVIAGSMHMARVSGHNLGYECPGTYLAMFGEHHYDIGEQSEDNPECH